MADDANTVTDIDTCGGFRQRANRAQATADYRALRNFENIPMYREGRDYDFDSDVPPANATVNYVRNIIEKYTNTAARTAINIENISYVGGITVVDTQGSHNLISDDIVKIANDSDFDTIPITSLTSLDTGFYRVRVIDADEFELVRLDTRASIKDDDTVADDGYAAWSGTSVSYTHLPLPTILLV